ncbi:MAG: esterase-like activity of phytase family protein [Acidimicrobiia bacterium]
MRSRFLTVTAAVALAVFVSGIAGALAPEKNATLPDQPAGAFQAVADDRGIRLGSLGSGLFRARGDKPHEYWMITDRGPNGQPNDKRTFAVPDFNPTMVKVRVKGEKIEMVERIPLTTTSGAPVSGLPNFAAVDSPLSDTPPAPDEVPHNFDGSAPLGTYNENGLDTEDIVRAPNGDFWIVDEYRPSVIKVAPDGTVLARYVPAGLLDEFTGAGYPVFDTLPASHAYRRQNRGYEGLAISPDGSTLFAALQSPLQLPPNPNVGRDSRNTRILRLEPDGTVTGEFVYRFEPATTFDPTPGNRPRDMKISALYALSATQVLVLERTDFVAKVYLVDTSAATDLGSWTSTGSNLNHLETLNGDGQLESNGVTPVVKSLVIDLETVTGMPDKIESIAVVNPSVLAVANDNDFGLTDNPTWDAAGRLSSDTGVRTRILYVTLPESLPGAGGPKLR